MDNNLETTGWRRTPLRSYALGIATLWSVLILLSLAWDIKNNRSGTLEAARIEARTAFEKDVIFRRWNTNHGGVYVPITESTQPNPYLDMPERDITTTSGKKLTTINPAFMTRQVHELEMKTHGVRGHITSLKPIRPANAPDPWERQALEAFHSGMKEVSSVEKMEGENFMRLMRPLLTEKGCLTCHAAQGYKLGGVQGGISVSIPMAPLAAISKDHILTLCLGHGLLWLVGLLGIGFGTFRLSQQIAERIEVQEALRESEKKYRQLADLLPQVVFETNEKGILTFANRIAFNLFDYTKNDFEKGLSALEMLIPEDRERARKKIQRILGGEKSAGTEYTVLRKDGNTFPALIYSSPIISEGKTVGLRGVVADLSEVKRTQEALKKSE